MFAGGADGQLDSKAKQRAQRRREGLFNEGLENDRKRARGLLFVYLAVAVAVLRLRLRLRLRCFRRLVTK